MNHTRRLRLVGAMVLALVAGGVCSAAEPEIFKLARSAPISWFDLYLKQMENNLETLKVQRNEAQNLEQVFEVVIDLTRKTDLANDRDSYLNSDFVENFLGRGEYMASQYPKAYPLRFNYDLEQSRFEVSGLIDLGEPIIRKKNVNTLLDTGIFDRESRKEILGRACERAWATFEIRVVPYVLLPGYGPKGLAESKFRQEILSRTEMTLEGSLRGIDSEFPSQLPPNRLQEEMKLNGVRTIKWEARRSPRTGKFLISETHKKD